MARNTVIWLSAALLGIVLTAALAWSASQLAGQWIGLSSEPLSALGRLAPPPPTGHTAPTGGATPSPRSAPARPMAASTHPPPPVPARRRHPVDSSGTAHGNPCPGICHDRSGPDFPQPALVAAVNPAGSEPAA